MANSKQKTAARKNIKKAQKKWKKMSKRQHSLAQPQGRARAKPGKGGGQYYRIEVRPKGSFKTFRYHDVGKRGKIQRLAGRRSSGSWGDQAWLIDKKMAHVRANRLVGDTVAAKKVLKEIGPAMHVKGDVFKGHIRKNVPEAKKPTAAQRRAQRRNIKKARAARRK